MRKNVLHKTTNLKMFNSLTEIYKTQICLASNTFHWCIPKYSQRWHFT